MEQINKNNILTIKHVILMVFGIVCSLALPQLLHHVGIVFNLGSSLGEIFLPMHIPVFAAAMLGGPIVGLVVGFLSPLLSFALSGMPGIVMLPYIVIELSVYGLVAGLFTKRKIAPPLALLAAQITGRVVKSIVLLVAITAFSIPLKLSVIFTTIIVGSVGIAIQWILVITMNSYLTKE